MELISAFYPYDWGKIGNDSLVAQLAALNIPGFKIDKEMSYAILCMGSLTGAGTNYKANGEAFTADLSFVLKVWSIGKATSLHVHPNKTDAEYLHSKEPQLYRDPSHKPELVIALTPFVCVCGFRPLTEIKDILLEIYPLRQLVIDNSDDYDLLLAGDEQGWRNCFRRLMEKDLEVVTRCVEAISKDFGKEMCKFDVLDVFNRLKTDFRKDIGVILIFFLNVIRLQPGQAIFANTNEIHGYLSGDCIECLTPSENVIRAGLTTKYKDIKQLYSVVNYKGVTADSVLLKPERIDEQCLVFKPPIEEFALMQLTLQPEDPAYVLQIEQAPGIMLVMSGQRTLEVNGVKQSLLKRGSILFLPYEVGTKLHFLPSEEGKRNFVAFIATPNIAPSAPPAPTTDTEMNN